MILTDLSNAIRKLLEKISFHKHFKNLLNSAISDGYCSAGFLAKIAGSIISCALAIGPISRLLTRQMYFAIETRISWESTTHFTPALLEELRFWHTNIDCFNGYRIQSSPSSCTILFSDAGGLAFGGYSATLAGSVVRGMWTSDDLDKSSTHRELKAIYYVLLSYVHQLQGRRVKIFTDNQAAARIASIGSARLDLQQIALQIFQTCIRNAIELDEQWVPRDCNEQADLLSRFVDKDDWAVNARIFRIVDAKRGPHTIDRFASYYNSQLPRFNSKHASPRSSGMDSFAQDWSNDNNWLCPPVNLIVQTVRKLQSCNGID